MLSSYGILSLISLKTKRDYPWLLEKVVDNDFGSNIDFPLFFKIPFILFSPCHILFNVKTSELGLQTAS